jgi:hypothetical protein
MRGPHDRDSSVDRRVIHQPPPLRTAILYLRRNREQWDVAALHETVRATQRAEVTRSHFRSKTPSRGPHSLAKIF